MSNTTGKRFVCSRAWTPEKTFFVREVKGEGGTDWGYTEEASKARPLNAYWMRRFRADMTYIGATGVSCHEVF